MSLREHEAWNEEMAHRYNPDAFITKTGYLVRKIQAMRLRKTVRALDCGPRDSVLDVGCGGGNLLEAIPSGRVVGLDLSDYLLGLTKEKFKGRKGLHVVKGNVETLPFSDNSFDRIACSEVLEHVQNPAAVISEIHRISKPGARVVLTVPNEELINFTKKIVILFRLKKWFAGDYPMSDDMLHAWHKTEIEEGWILDACRGRFEHKWTWNVPLPVLSYHRILVFITKK